MKKLSELTTDELADLSVNIIPAFGEIVSDNEILKMFKGEKDEKETAFEFGIRRIVNLIPLLLQQHKESIYKILSVFNGKSIEETKTQKGMKTISELMFLLSDKDLKSFFE